ncbi:alpha/beta hydrolase [Kitasatospora sp. NPDC056327]|uniref:alpha/beta hydrolase n=1 Tax=Kitasatospora sp. NPDC056327 TaxID=3345785 RepID=UPI0035DB96A2
MHRRIRALALLPALAAVTAATALGATASPARAAGGGTPGGGRVVPAADRRVTFDADGTTVFGTLHVPAHRAGHRLAAALLLPGSGPTDRDGDQPPALTPSTLALTAGVLGDDGVMTLRFDKYGTGETGPGRYGDDPGSIDTAAFTRQAAAAYDTLRRQPEADPRALLIVGHSEGALRALLVAPAVRPAPAGLALVAPQTRRILDTLAAQLADRIDRAAADGVLTAEQARDSKDGVARAVGDFRAGRPVDTGGIVAPVAAVLEAVFGPLNARYTRTHDAVDPQVAARRTAPGTRVTVTCGTEDANVPCATTPPLLAGLAAARVTGPGLRVLPGVDHLLHPAGTPVGDRVLAPAAVAALRDFVRPWRSR